MNMASLRGCGQRGERVRAKGPYGHWNTLTSVAALRHDRIDAPWLIDESMTMCGVAPSVRDRGSSLRSGSTSAPPTARSRLQNGVP
jgi:hypothetical protein